MSNASETPFDVSSFWVAATVAAIGKQIGILQEKFKDTETSILVQRIEEDLESALVDSRVSNLLNLRLMDITKQINHLAATA